TGSARRVFVKAATSSNTKTRIRSSEKSLKRNSRNREEKVRCAQAKENHPEDLTPRYNLSKSARQTLTSKTKMYYQSGFVKPDFQQARIINHNPSQYRPHQTALKSRYENLPRSIMCVDEYCGPVGIFREASHVRGSTASRFQSGRKI